MALALLLAASTAMALDIPVNCGNMQVGTISVDAVPNGISGGFKSTDRSPPSLAQAAKDCNQDHFNWYQVVISGDTGAMVNGQPLKPPYIDPPAEGIDGGLWSDNLPGYWDEYSPNAKNDPKGKLYNNAYLLNTNLISDGCGTGPGQPPCILHYEDFPSFFPGTTVQYVTYLASVNKDGSFDSFEGGFTWTYTSTGMPQMGNVTGISYQGTSPPDKWYKDILTGFAPEPSSFVMLATGLGSLIGLQRFITRSRN
jgi:hypothetical protein